MTGQKPDAGRIREWIEQLSRDFKSTERSWWPQFVYHYTDLNNAISILEAGTLFSRALAEDMGLLKVNGGSSAVLAGTTSDIKNYVRFYFRPKTPTQYHTEGIHSVQTLSSSRFDDAHCSVPVFFLFDSAAILARSDCHFSDGNMGSPRSRMLTTAEELEQLRWDQIYHNSRLPSGTQGKEIVFRRSAEVLVPERVQLDALRWVYCRTEAERQTLLYMLSNSTRSQYLKRIVSTGRYQLFYRERTFVERVTWTGDRLVVWFNPDTHVPGPFELVVRTDYGSGPAIGRVKDFMVQHPFRWPVEVRPAGHTFSLHLDGHLAYANRHELLSPLP